MGIIKQCTRPHLSKMFFHPPPPTEKDAPYSPIHPHSTKIMSHPPKITHTDSKKCLTNRHLQKIWSNNPHLLKLLFDLKVK